MILLDTNAVSEPWQPEPDPRFVAWIDAQAVETLSLSAVTVTELRFGIAGMAKGQRRKILPERLEGELLPVFAGRVQAFDLEASRAYAELIAKARIAGMAINMADGYIAAIAAAQGFYVALRDTGPFQLLESASSTYGQWRLEARRFCAHGGHRVLVRRVGCSSAPHPQGAIKAPVKRMVHQCRITDEIASKAERISSPSPWPIEAATCW